MFMRAISKAYMLGLSLGEGSVVVVNGILLFLSLMVLRTQLPSLSLTIPFLASFSETRLTSILTGPLSDIIHGIEA